MEMDIGSAQSTTAVAPIWIWYPAKATSLIVAVSCAPRVP